MAAGAALYISYAILYLPHTSSALPCFMLLAIRPDFGDRNY
jgi:hypothetical protein